jgi:hypothetical protein
MEALWCFARATSSLGPGWSEGIRGGRFVCMNIRHLSDVTLTATARAELANSILDWPETAREIAPPGRKLLWRVR